ncbi:MAG: HU family DNA-binding protein [Pseudomonadota bacterium]
MTKAELINKIYEENYDRGVTKVIVEEIVDSCFTTLAKSIKKDKRFTYPGFGTWTLKNRKARMGRNPQTGEEIKIKASKTVTFKPSSRYKDTL